MDLLILCCFGGVPFIQFPSSSSKQPLDRIRHQWDPTDWVAVDVTDSLFTNNSSSFSSLNPLLKNILPSDISTINLEQCDLWNLTFASNADKHLFKKSHGKLKCRCPFEYIGIACQQQKTKEKTIKTLNKTTNKTLNNKTFPSFPSSPPSPLSSPPSLLTNLTTKQTFKTMALIGGTTTTFSGNSFIWFLLVFMVLALIMVSLFMMFRGCCFCDCFGGIPNNRRYDQPLTPQTINRCMEAIKEHEREGKAKYSASGEWSIAPPPPPQQQPTSFNNCMVIDSRRPLLPQQTTNSISSISETIPPPNIRACSPPPSYRSSNGSIDKINK
uniref:EGF-like domain-containing protein n=1 Tax=Meloidogyne incognita TaxID=6306 RepID=A0A914LT49_MELIC